MRVVNSKTQKLIGAVLVEVPLLDVFAGVVGSIPRVSQLSYGFVVDSDGVVWTHPALSLPSLNDTSPPRTALLESAEPAFYASAWERLRRRENGSVDLTVSIVCMTHAHRVCDADLVLWVWCGVEWSADHAGGAAGWILGGREADECRSDVLLPRGPGLAVHGGRRDRGRQRDDAASDELSPGILAESE
jgi:hypothetical protein